MSTKKGGSTNWRLGGGYQSRFIVPCSSEGWKYPVGKERGVMGLPKGLPWTGVMRLCRTKSLLTCSSYELPLIKWWSFMSCGIQSVGSRLGVHSWERAPCLWSTRGDSGRISDGRLHTIDLPLSSPGSLSISTRGRTHSGWMENHGCSTDATDESSITCVWMDHMISGQTNCIWKRCGIEVVVNDSTSVLL